MLRTAHSLNFEKSCREFVENLKANLFCTMYSTKQWVRKPLQNHQNGQIESDQSFFLLFISPLLTMACRRGLKCLGLQKIYRNKVVGLQILLARSNNREYLNWCWVIYVSHVFNGTWLKNIINTSKKREKTILCSYSGSLSEIPACLAHNHN